MSVSEMAVAGWSTKMWGEDVFQLLKTRSPGEFQSERRDAEVVSHDLGKIRASLRATNSVPSKVSTGD